MVFRWFKFILKPPYSIASESYTIGYTYGLILDEISKC